MEDSNISDKQSQYQPVTVLFDRTVRPGKENEYKQWYKDLIALSEQSSGHVSTHVIRQGRRYVTLQQFADSASLEAWLNSPERLSQLRKLNELTEKAPEPQSLTGLEPWFELPTQAAPHVPKWKMMLVTFGVIYALVTILSYTVMPFIADWPIILRSLVFPAVMVPLMTYIIMPNLTKALKRWLFK